MARVLRGALVIVCIFLLFLCDRVTSNYPCDIPSAFIGGHDVGISFSDTPEPAGGMSDASICTVAGVVQEHVWRCEVRYCCHLVCNCNQTNLSESNVCPTGTLLSGELDCLVLHTLPLRFYRRVCCPGYAENGDKVCAALSTTPPSTAATTTSTTATSSTTATPSTTSTTATSSTTATPLTTSTQSSPPTLTPTSSSSTTTTRPLITTSKPTTKMTPSATSNPKITSTILSSTTTKSTTTLTTTLKLDRSTNGSVTEPVVLAQTTNGSVTEPVVLAQTDDDTSPDWWWFLLALLLLVLLALLVLGCFKCGLCCFGGAAKNSGEGTDAYDNRLYDYITDQSRMVCDYIMEAVVTPLPADVKKHPDDDLGAVAMGYPNPNYIDEEKKCPPSEYAEIEVEASALEKKLPPPDLTSPGFYYDNLPAEALHEDVPDYFNNLSTHRPVRDHSKNRSIASNPSAAREYFNNAATGQTNYNNFITDGGISRPNSDYDQISDLHQDPPPPYTLKDVGVTSTTLRRTSIPGQIEDEDVYSELDWGQLGETDAVGHPISRVDTYLQPDAVGHPISRVDTYLQPVSTRPKTTCTSGYLEAIQNKANQHQF